MTKKHGINVRFAEGIVSKMIDFDALSAEIIGAAEEAGLNCGTLFASVDEKQDKLTCLFARKNEGPDTLFVSTSTMYAFWYIPSLIRDNADKLSALVSGETFSVVFLPDMIKENEYTFVGKTDRDPLLYRLGDSVTIRATLTDKKGKLLRAPLFYWKAEKDGEYTDSLTAGRLNGVCRGVSGEIGQTFPGCTVPGVLRLNVIPYNEDCTNIAGECFDGSVVFNFDDVRTATPLPDDFDGFWKKKLEALDAIGVHGSHGLCRKFTREGYLTYDAEADYFPGEGKVYFHVSVPENAAPGTLDIRAGFPGYGGCDIGPGYAENTIYVNVNPHGFENDREEDYYLGKDVVMGERIMTCTELEKSGLVDLLLRDVLALKYVQKNFSGLWNGKVLRLGGGSMGGYQSVGVAALLGDGVTSIDVGIPWMCDINSETAKRIPGWRPGYSDASKYCDTCLLASRLRCPITVNAGLGDYVCPPSGVVSMYNSVPHDKKSLRMVQCMGHGCGGGADNDSSAVSGGRRPADARRLAGEGNPATLIANGCGVPEEYDPEVKYRLDGKSGTPDLNKAVSDKLQTVSDAIDSRFQKDGVCLITVEFGLNAQTTFDYISARLSELWELPEGITAEMTPVDFFSFKIPYTGLSLNSTMITEATILIGDRKECYIKKPITLQVTKRDLSNT